MLLGVCVEVGLILGNVVPQLLLLELPDVLLLVAVWVDLNALWDIDPLLEGTACVHVVYDLLVGLDEVCLWSMGAVSQRLLKPCVPAISVGVSLLNLDLLLFIILILYPHGDIGI